MSFLDYLREKWMTYLFLVLGLVFTLMVYKVDRSFRLESSNANYILMGWGLFFTIFVGIDYAILRNRVKRLKAFFHLKVSIEALDELSYPTDREYGMLIYSLAVAYEDYKAEIYSKAAEEMDFITKWLHDVKVPISATRLILENHQQDIPRSLYQSIDTELFSIEESVQRVFYEIKSNRFQDDYRLSRVNTKKLISQALKGYSSFFSYNRINIAIEGEGHEVVTDEKWSGYILSQIVSNAVKYTPVNGQIIITTKKTEDETTISIKNTGKGILDKDIGQIFNKGYTASEGRQGMKSTGYGMYLSKKLANLLGHRLTVTSEYGQYAIFHLVFKENQTLHHVTKL